MLAISLTIACSCYTYDGVILHAHPVRGESHNQRNTTGEVATISRHLSQRKEDYLSSLNQFKEKAIRSYFPLDNINGMIAITSNWEERPWSPKCNNKEALHVWDTSLLHLITLTKKVKLQGNDCFQKTYYNWANTNKLQGAPNPHIGKMLNKVCKGWPTSRSWSDQSIAPEFALNWQEFALNWVCIELTYIGWLCIHFGAFCDGWP